MDNETSKGEVLEAISELATHVDKRFDKIETDLTDVKQRVTKIESKMVIMESKMVTKEYLDDKLIQLRGDTIDLVRKEDAKVKVVVGKLQEKNIFNEADVKQIHSLEPFPNRP